MAVNIQKPEPEFLVKWNLVKHFGITRHYWNRAVEPVHGPMFDRFKLPQKPFRISTQTLSK